MVFPAKRRSRSARVSGAVALALTLLLRAPSAFGDDGQAERLFREGRALLLEGRFDEACPMLEQSQRLEPHVGTLLNVAACHERQGKVGSAWVDYQKALTAARAEGQTDRVALAEQRIKAIEPRVPWLRIASDLEGASISLDGGEVARVALDHELPVDPGAHVVIAERRGARVFEEHVDLRESEHRTVRVSVTEHAGEAPSDPRLVIEQRPSETAAKTSPSKPEEKSRWVFEPGIFVGYLGGTASHPKISLGRGSDVTLVPISGGAATDNASCASASCKVGEIGDAGGPAAGIHAFVGYALSEQMHLGVRLLAAPALGFQGGSVWAGGPSVVLHPTESLALGIWGLFGDATIKGNAFVDAPQGYRVSGSSMVPAEGGLAGGVGLGVDLSFKLFELGRGSVVANTTPFFLAGSTGGAFCLPLGVAYRFQ